MGKIVFLVDIKFHIQGIDMDGSNGCLQIIQKIRWIISIVISTYKKVIQKIRLINK